VPLDAERFDPVSIAEALAAADVDFVVIGGVAGAAHGSSFTTYDLAIAYAREAANLEKLAGALSSLGATLRGAPADVPFLLDARTLAHGSNFTFTTPRGSIDIFAEPLGAPPYEKLRAEAIVVDLGGQAVRIASLAHLIAMKEAAGRPKDQTMAAEYRLIADQLAPGEPP
jgi:hypothetical protein